MIGRPKTRYQMIGRCEVCRDQITWLSSDSKPKTRRTCSTKCRMALIRAPRLKCPNAEKLRKLYLVDRLSTPQIASMYNTDASTVNKALCSAGIETRSKTVVTRCQVYGCRNFPKKVRHTNNGSEYGTLCAAHREQHRNNLSREYWKREGESITLMRRVVRGARSPRVLTGEDMASIFEIEVEGSGNDG